MRREKERKEKEEEKKEEETWKWNQKAWIIISHIQYFIIFINLRWDLS